MQFQVDDRVRKSAYALRSKRDYWLAQGDSRRKEQAKDWLDQATAERGTVAEILAGDSSRGVSPGVRVAWDNGSESKCLPCMIETINPPLEGAILVDLETLPDGTAPIRFSRSIRVF